MEKSWNMTNLPEVMEFCYESWNFTEFAPKLYQICMFFATTIRYTEDAGLPYFDRATAIANGTWLCGSALKSMGAKLCFRSCLINIGPSYT